MTPGSGLRQWGRGRDFHERVDHVCHPEIGRRRARVSESVRRCHERPMALVQV